MSRRVTTLFGRHVGVRSDGGRPLWSCMISVFYRYEAVHRDEAEGLKVRTGLQYDIVTA